MKNNHWILWLIITLVGSCSYPHPATLEYSPPRPVRIQDEKQRSENMQAISSKIAQNLYLYGMNFYQRGMYQLAIERLSLAIEDDPKFLAPYMALGEIYYLIQQLHSAEVNYKRALELDPSLVEARVGLGIIYWERGKYELAEEYLTTALELQPNQPQALQHLKLTQQKFAQQHLKQGIAFRDSGEWEQAKLKFKLAIQNDSQLGEAYLELGGVYLFQQQYQPAVDNLLLALEIIPETAMGWRYLGKAYLGQYEYDEARKALQRNLILNPRDEAGKKLLELAQQELYRDKLIPDEFLQISSTPAITRGQLAALLALNLKLPFEKRLPTIDVPVIIPDISSHWARAYIIYVVRNQLMREYPNHYFLPDSFLTRGETAYVIDNTLQRLAGLVAVTNNYQDGGYEDVSPDNQYYGAIIRVAALGLIHTQGVEFFGVTNKLSGLEALEIVDRLANFLSQ